MRFQTQQIPCKVAFIEDGLSLKVIKFEFKGDDHADLTEHKNFISQSKPVPVLCGRSEGLSSTQNLDIIAYQSATSFSKYSGHPVSNDSFGMARSSCMSSFSNRSLFFKARKSALYGVEENNYSFGQTYSEAPILCTTCGARTEKYCIKDAMIFKYNEIQAATENFAKENLLGEGGYGHVYKGKLENGQLIAAKVRKEESSLHLEFTLQRKRTISLGGLHLEFCSSQEHSHVARLLLQGEIQYLGFMSIFATSLFIGIYMVTPYYIDKEATPLEWHQRFAIAIGTAKGLRFLHEECRGGPIIHRDVRPSNILITHDFIPMLGDFGLAKWKTTDDTLQTRILGTLGYLAPEYAENRIVSVRTDVYAYGIVLLQLMSGRKVVIDVEGEEIKQSLRQWAEPIIQRLALHELIDPRIGDSYDTYELYCMAKAAYSCIQRSPEMRPSIGEVVRLLEGENDHFHHFGDQFIPHYTKE